MVNLSSWVSNIGLLLDLFGAVIVLGSDWNYLYHKMVELGKRSTNMRKPPVIGFPFRKLEFLYRLEEAEKELLSGRYEDLNWDREAPPLNETEEGFEALKQILVDELDVLPQFNRVTVGVTRRGHTNRPNIGRYYLNTSILTIMEDRYKKGIEPWHLRDYIDSAPVNRVENAISEKKSGIIVGIGARLLVFGFALQLISGLIPQSI